MMRSKHVTGIAAIVAFASIGSVSLGALLGILPGFPTLVFDNTGTTTYDAGTDLYSVDASPVAIRFTPTSTPRFVTPTGNPPETVLTIRIIVDDAGTLISGVPVEDLIVKGEVDQDGDTIPDFTGLLLTGEASEFGFEDTGTATDLYDFRFTVTGGALATFFANMDIGVKLTSETSDFGGSFTAGFGGEAKGILGPIALPLQLGGCTPGYWKQEHHFDSWPAPFTPDTLFESVFQRDVPGDPVLVEALRLKRGGLNALMRHSTAALLNAASPVFDSDEAFDTVDEVIPAFQAAFDSGDYETTKNLFEDSNELGCPLN